MSAQLPTVNGKVPMDLSLAKQARAYFTLLPERQRSHGYHPSEVSKESWCPVLHWFVEEANDKMASTDPNLIREGYEFKKAVLKAKKFKNAGKLKQEFVYGDDIHRLVQYLLGVCGKLRGRWACAWCRAETREVGWMPRTQVESVSGDPMFDAAPCMACHGRNLREDISWLYVEPSIGWTQLAAELGMDGHVDGDLWDYRDGQWYRYVLEVKSINEWGFCEGKNPHWEDLALGQGWHPPQGWRPAPPNEKRVLPKVDHVSQATIYAAAQGISHVCFVYVNKNQVSQWKEFVVPLDPEALAQARSRIQVVEEARMRRAGPPVHARVCADVRDETARECPASERCFGCKAPEAFRW